MRIDRIRAHGLGEFTEDIDIDFTALPGLIVALVGNNGAGKSTALELALAGPYRRLPTRGSLKDMAAITGCRDAFVEVAVTNGASHVIRHTVDGISGKCESLILDDAGKPRLPTTSVKAFDEWAASHFPPEEVAYTSFFALQRSRAKIGRPFLDLDESERKSVILQSLGLERIETLAERARERAKDAREALTIAANRLRDEESRIVPVATAEHAFASAEQVKAAAETVLLQALTASNEAMIAITAWDTAEAVRVAVRTQRAEIRHRFDVAHGRCLVLRGRQDANAALRARATTIREAVDRLASFDADMARTQKEVDRLADAIAKAEHDRVAHDRLVFAASERARLATARTDAARAQLAAVRDGALADAAGLEKRIRECRQTLAEGDQIRAVVARVADLDASMASLDAEIRNEERAGTEASRAVGEAERAAREAETRRAGATARSANAKIRLRDRETVEASARDLPRLRSVLEEHEREVARLDGKIEAARALLLDNATSRITGLQTGLQSVCDASMLEDAQTIARDTLFRDAQSERNATMAPLTLQACEPKRNIAFHAANEARRRLADAERLAARAEDFEAAERDHRAAAEDGRMAAEETDAARKRAAECRQAVVDSKARVDGHGTRKTLLSAERNALTPTAKRIERLGHAEATIAALEPQRDGKYADAWKSDQDLAAFPPGPGEEAETALHEADVARVAALTAMDDEVRYCTERDEHLATLACLATGRAPVASLAAEHDALTRAEAVDVEIVEQLARTIADRNAIDAELAALPEPSSPSPPPSLDTYSGAVGKAERGAREAHGALAVAKATLETAYQADARLLRLRVDVGALQDELADWTMLAADLGKDGLQAMEIDAAGPEISEYANDLFRTCGLSRWSCSVETARLSADGKKTIEGCGLLVTDNERGSEKTGEQLSGGQKAIISEAIALALSMVACRRAGLSDITLIRDETSAALDSEAATAYVAMLRRVAAILGVRQILMVSHSPAVIALADSQIHFANGKVRVAA